MTFGATAEASVGNFNDREISASVTGPLSSDFGRALVCRLPEDRRLAGVRCRRRVPTPMTGTTIATSTPSAANISSNPTTMSISCSSATIRSATRHAATPQPPTWGPSRASSMRSPRFRALGGQPGATGIAVGERLPDLLELSVDTADPGHGSIRASSTGNWAKRRSRRLLRGATIPLSPATTPTTRPSTSCMSLPATATRPTSSNSARSCAWRARQARSNGW